MKKIILLSLLVLVLATGCNSIFNKKPSIPTVTTPAVQKQTFSGSSSSSSSSNSVGKTSTSNTNPLILTVSWQDPAAISDQGLIKEGCTPSNSYSNPCEKMEFSYYKTGTVTTEGSYKGAQLIVFDCSCATGIGEQDHFMRFLKVGSNFTLLQKYSTDLGFMKDQYSPDKVSFAPFKVDNSIDIPLLDPGKEIICGSCSVASIEGSGPKLSLLHNSIDLGLFFTDATKNSKSVFVDLDGMRYYQAFFGYGSGNELENSVNPDAIVLENFYTRAADGTTLEYQYRPSFVSYDSTNGLVNGLHVAWVDNRTHNNPYDFDQPDACSDGTAYINEIKNTVINLSDLTQVAKSADGQKIYELTNQNSPIIQSVKENIDQLNTYASSTVIYNPDMLLYWQDPFGRLARFTYGFQQPCGG